MLCELTPKIHLKDVLIVLRALSVAFLHMSNKIHKESFNIIDVHSNFSSIPYQYNYSCMDNCCFVKKRVVSIDPIFPDYVSKYNEYFVIDYLNNKCVLRGKKQTKS